MKRKRRRRVSKLVGFTLPVRGPAACLRRKRGHRGSKLVGFTLLVRSPVARLRGRGRRFLDLVGLALLVRESAFFPREVVPEAMVRCPVVLAPRGSGLALGTGNGSRVAVEQAPPFPGPVGHHRGAAWLLPGHLDVVLVGLTLLAPRRGHHWAGGLRLPGPPKERPPGPRPHPNGGPKTLMDKSPRRKLPSTKPKMLT